MSVCVLQFTSMHTVFQRTCRPTCARNRSEVFKLQGVFVAGTIEQTKGSITAQKLTWLPEWLGAQTLLITSLFSSLAGDKMPIFTDRAT